MVQRRYLVKYKNLDKYEKAETDNIFDQVTHLFFTFSISFWGSRI